MSHIIPRKKKVKEADLYSAFIEVPHTQGAQVRITQCYLQITPNYYLCLPSYSWYSFTDPGGMEG